MFLVKRDHFNKNYIIKGLITALIFSAFIYLKYFGIDSKILHTLLALFAFYLLLTLEKNALFYVGFFVGILWFYWVGNSLVYYDVAYLYPLIVVVFALTYGLLFYTIALYDHILFRALILFLLSYIHPFGFNWFIPELLFIESFFPTSKAHFALILACLFMFIRLNPRLKFLAVIPLLCIYQNKGLYIDNPPIAISMPQIHLSQDQKWLKSNLSSTIENNLNLIEDAIEEKKELIILPETAFPLLLNNENFLMTNLLKKSEVIDIIVGALYVENSQFYNATYHFSQGNFSIAKKVVLVPFGEKIPLPQFLVDWINATFYNGAQDYQKAEKPTDFIIKGEKFRNAICYEATSEEIYQNLGEVKYMIAISNNAWFTPSIEPTLQDLLLKYYTKKYEVTLFHVVNGSKNKIYRP